MGHYEFGEHADVYTQLMFTDYQSIAQIAPSGDFFETTTINCDNPLLPAGILGTIGCDAGAIAAGTSVPMYIGRRNVEGGGRQQSFANAAFRVGGRRPRRDQRGLGLRRFGPVLEGGGHDGDAQLLTSHRVWRVRSTCTTSAACRPASRSSTARIRTACPGIRSSRAA